MSLNQNFSGAALMSGRRKLEGPDRGLDALVGVVIFVAELLIGFLVVDTLYLYGVDAAKSATGSALDNIQGGFAIALIGSAVVVGITTLIFLVRLARGRRSWPAPLWGLILLSAATIFGYLVMSG